MSLMGKVPSEVSKEARQFKIECKQSQQRKLSSSGSDVPGSLCLHEEACGRDGCRKADAFSALHPFRAGS